MKSKKVLKKPWETGKALNTEKKQVAWLRGALRKAWTRYPTQNEYKNERRVRVVVYDEDGEPVVYKTGKKAGQVKKRWDCPCDKCEEIFPASKVQVDHIIPAGGTDTMEDLLDWMQKIFCGTDNLQLLCEECHKIKTHCDNSGMCWEDAIIDLDAIRICKRKANVTKRYIKWRWGATEDEISNPQKRREYCFNKLKEEIL